MQCLWVLFTKMQENMKQGLNVAIGLSTMRGEKGFWLWCLSRMQGDKGLAMHVDMVSQQNAECVQWLRYLSRMQGDKGLAMHVAMVSKQNASLVMRKKKHGLGNGCEQNADESMN